MFGTSFPVRALDGGYNTLIAILCKVSTSRQIFEQYLINKFEWTNAMRPSQYSCRYPLKQTNKENLKYLTCYQTMQLKSYTYHFYVQTQLITDSSLKW